MRGGGALPQGGAAPAQAEARRERKPMGDEADAKRFAAVLGQALIARWSAVPPDLQQQLFEEAVLLGHRGERDESLREELARFLHEHHARTAHKA